LTINNGLSYYADYAFTPTGTAQNLGNLNLNSLYVGPNTNVSADSINANTLSIGSTPSASSNSVPEPSTIGLLAMAGIAGAGVALNGYNSRRKAFQSLL
jgi:hypothetical protein